MGVMTRRTYQAFAQLQHSTPRCGATRNIARAETTIGETMGAFTGQFVFPKTAVQMLESKNAFRFQT